MLSTSTCRKHNPHLRSSTARKTTLLGRCAMCLEYQKELCHAGVRNWIRSVRFCDEQMSDKLACMQDGEEVMRLTAENKRLASLLAEAENAAEEAAQLRDVLEAERESRTLQVPMLSHDFQRHIAISERVSFLI